MSERDGLAELSLELRKLGVEIQVEDLAAALLGSTWLERERMEAGAQALDDAAAAIYNGSGDPEQELYDHGASPWLTLRAMVMRSTFVLKQRQKRD